MLGAFGSVNAAPIDAVAGVVPSSSALWPARASAIDHVHPIANVMRMDANRTSGSRSDAGAVPATLCRPREREDVLDGFGERLPDLRYVVLGRLPARCANRRQ